MTLEELMKKEPVAVAGNKFYINFKYFQETYASSGKELDKKSIANRFIDAKEHSEEWLEVDLNENNQNSAIKFFNEVDDTVIKSSVLSEGYAYLFRFGKLVHSFSTQGMNKQKVRSIATEKMREVMGDISYNTLPENLPYRFTLQIK